MCTVLRPLGGYPIAVNKYIIYPLVVVVGFVCVCMCVCVCGGVLSHNCLYIVLHTRYAVFKSVLLNKFVCVDSDM